MSAWSSRGSEYSEDLDEAGYPYRDRDDAILRRSPYEERMVRDVERAGDPYANASSRRSHRTYRDEDPPPILTLTQASRPSSQQFSGPPPQQFSQPSSQPSSRPSTRPSSRSAPRRPFDRILSGSESPPSRAPRGVLEGFRDTFGDLPRPTRGSGQYLQRGPPGPRNPYRQLESQPRREPYGDGREPHNPFRPGGSHYDYERAHGERHPSLQPRNQEGMDERARRRDDFYHRSVGESWGLAQLDAYDRRRQHEQRMRDLARREPRRERSDRSHRSQQGDRGRYDGYRYDGYGRSRDDGLFEE